MKAIKTVEVVRIENYPYGFNAKTTLFDKIEFNPKKGYRHITQTVNPKTGKLNQPKKSTYYPLLVRYFHDNGHINTVSFSFNGSDSINKGCKFIAENFDLFTADEIQYLYGTVLFMATVDVKATVIYGGAKFDDLKPLYDPFILTCKTGMKTGKNLFPQMVLDIAAIEATKPADYNPFVVTNYGQIV